MRVKFDKNDFPFSKLLQHDQNIKVLLISILILFTYYHKTLARGGQRFFVRHFIQYEPNMMERQMKNSH